MRTAIDTNVISALWSGEPASQGMAALLGSEEKKAYNAMKDQPPTETKGPSSFHIVVEAADRLTEEEQETLIEVLNRRLADRRRAELVTDIHEAQRESEGGALRPTAPHEIMKEILKEPEGPGPVSGDRFARRLVLRAGSSE